MGEIFLWEQTPEIMEHAKRTPLEVKASADAKPEYQRADFVKLCNDASLFNDFGHFIVNDSGYAGGDTKWKVKAPTMVISKDGGYHRYECWYSA